MDGAEDSKEIRQVGHLDQLHDNVSCPDPSLGKSTKSRTRALLRAKLRAAEIQKEFELMKALNEVRLAELALSSDDEDSSVQTEPCKNRVADFIRDCENVKDQNVEREPVVCIKSCNHSPRFDLPKVELEPFVGNPRTYWRFMQQFRFYVEDRVPDSGQRFLYLMYYCRGPAKDAIAECVSLRPDKAFTRAKLILKDLFGREHVVARAMIDDLFDRVRVFRNGSISLSDLSVTMQNCEIALGQMGYVSDLNSITTMERVILALPLDARQRWARRADEMNAVGRTATFTELCEFVSSEARVASSRYGMLASTSRQRPSIEPRQSHRVSLLVPQTNTGECPVCSCNHVLAACDRFNGMPVVKRWNLVKRKRLCYACLNHGHVASACKTFVRCSIGDCSDIHHPLLHAMKPGSNNRNCNASINDSGNACLGIVPVQIKGPASTVITYALLDSGADVTLIDKQLVTELGLVGTSSPLSLSTITGRAEVSTDKVDLEITSLDGRTSKITGFAYCMPSLSLGVAAADLNVIATEWPHFRGLSFRNISDKRVRLLIGTDIPEAHWPLDRRLGKPKQPFAIKTPLGWTMLGPLSAGRKPWGNVYFTGKRDDLSSQIQLLYDTEFGDIEAGQAAYSANELIAVNLVKQSTTLRSGHFEIGIPWNGTLQMPNNYGVAYRRLISLRRRFNANQDLYVKYKEVMLNNLKKGYVAKVPAHQLRPAFSPRWYLPHHPVINPKKPGKIRVVMDCAAKYQGISLNDRISKCPDTTANLVSVLLRFRAHYIAVSADIEEMFMQVKVPEVDRGALRFLWWDTDDIYEQPTEYQMLVHPFGATSSPFCANFALRQTAELWGSDCTTVARESIDKHFYVDDCLASLPNVADAKMFVEELTGMVGKGGFHLRKWLSNVNEVLEELPDTELAPSVLSICNDDNISERTLGLEWHTKTDTFRFRFMMNQRVHTRRTLLSAVSSLFDPLGLISPLILPAKCLLQRLCKNHLDWDDELPEKDLNDWLSWVKCMNALGSIKIPRCVRPRDAVPGDPELHVFSDASELGYGVVGYLRWLTNGNTFECRMLYAKSRVAPIKFVSIPRLELNAARLAARVAEELKGRSGIVVCSTTLWTDSMIVLHYIRNMDTQFSTFVSNRVSTIRQLTTIEQWRHVDGKSNPADLNSRGTTSISTMSEWLIGPTFLSLNRESWPVEASYGNVAEGLELKSKRVTVHHVTSNVEGGLYQLIHRCSEWPKLIRYIVWLTRFKTFTMLISTGNVNLKLNVGNITRAEWKTAEGDVLRLAQRESFPELFEQLGKGNQLNRKIYNNVGVMKLCPILHDELLCVGGRLENNKWPHVASNPIILSAKHHVTQLLMRYFHVVNCHSGVSHTLSMLRERFWIIGGTVTMKQIVRHCWTCRKNVTTGTQQIMAPLPHERLEVGWHPFKTVGIDYFGPFTVKQGRRSVKRYGCIFTCLQTRAVHLEMAYSLNTDSFITVLMRFIARRGAPDKIISDNGSNFVGAELELRKAIQHMPHTKIIDHLLERNVEWQFNPPLSSHRGGIWERLIRSVRRILRSTIMEQELTDEKLVTFLTEAERILNSRPIVPWPGPDIAQPALTPNDLLILNRRVRGVVPESITERYIKGWQQVNYLTSIFWKRWTREYLPTLQQRQKWLRPVRNLRQGDVVIVISGQLPRERWPLGVVEEIEEPIDNRVRTVMVRTSEGVLRRDVRKLGLIEACE